MSIAPSKVRELLGGEKSDTVNFRTDKSHFTIVVALEEECSGETDDTGTNNCHKGSFVFLMSVVGHSVESELNEETKRWGRTFFLSHAFLFVGSPLSALLQSDRLKVKVCDSLLEG